LKARIGTSAGTGATLGDAAAVDNIISSNKGNPIPIAPMPLRIVRRFNLFFMDSDPL
jgi:hypothetical protein